MNHIAVIVDGNRRYAQKVGKKSWEGHREGAKKVKEFLSWCRDSGIHEATLYTFSMQNFNRPKNEVDALFDMFGKELKKELRTAEFKKHNVKVRFIGRIHLFPEAIYEDMHSLMKQTERCTEYTLNLAMAYGGREEIVDAVNALVRSGKNHITEELITSHVYLDSEPDLVIRTGGAMRTSNFLAWQTIHSEWIFIDKFFPQLTKKDFDNALKEFDTRERRFGK